MSEKDYERAREAYREGGVDSESAIERVLSIPISVHCWQGDDVIGFDGAGTLSGGIQTTGNYPGRARNFEELKADLHEAFSLMPGKRRLNLHASYAIFDGEKVDRDAYRPEHFDPWIDFAKEEGLDGIDFNPTLFSHPMLVGGLSLSSPREEVRKFWVRHVISSLRISEHIAERMGSPVLMNIWIPDGFKDVPADRLGPRLRLKKSLDEILATPYDRKKVIVAVESKVFGIGVESYTVGSNEFYQNYAALKGICCLLDNGHYHPLEYVSDKIPSLLAFHEKVALHVTRGVRWDSDHVVSFEDELKEIAREIIRNDADERVLIGLDYFDASINRIAAWAIGERNVRKALLYAALMPNERWRELQDKASFTSLYAEQEEWKTMPFGAVWDECLRRAGVPGRNWTEEVGRYEREVLSKR